MVLNYRYSESLLLINKNLTKELFLQKAGVTKGYAYEMFSSMYDSIHSELINVKEEYNKYYSFEYPTPEDFLYKKLNIKWEHIETVIKQMKKNPDYILYRKSDDYSHGHYGLTQFTFSETMYKRVEKILLLKGK
jgi:hypothetical protein